MQPEGIVNMRPPIDIRKPGRPCKKRKRAYDEGHTEKKVRSCSRCKTIGHNKRTCAGAPVGSNPKAKRQKTMVQGGCHSTSYPDPHELSTSRRGRKATRGRGGASIYPLLLNHHRLNLQILLLLVHHHQQMQVVEVQLVVEV